MLAWTTARARAVTVGAGLVARMACRVASSQTRTTLSRTAGTGASAEAATGVRTATRVATESSATARRRPRVRRGGGCASWAPWVVVVDATADSEPAGWRIG